MALRLLKTGSNTGKNYYKTVLKSITT